ncbi:MAG: DUF6177 family protein [Ornithinimicrobium sp.]
MSDDWLILSSTPLEFADVILAVDSVDPSLQLRADHSQRFTVLVDDEDQPRLWVGPSREAHDFASAAQRFLPHHDSSTPVPWWTEVVAPASATQGSSPSSPTVQDFSAALAHQVEGVAVHLSSDQPEDALQAPSADADDPPFDFVTADSAVALQTRPVLGLTPWMTTCLLWARDHERTFVVLTPRSTRLTPVLADLVDRGAVEWIADEGGITHDARSAAEVRWDGSRFVVVDPPNRLHPETPPTGRVWSLVAEVDTLHSASEPVSVGALAQHVAHSCGVGPLAGQGLMEPVEAAFDQASLTTFSQSESPGPARFLLTGERADAVGSLVPQPVGLLERVELFGQAPREPFDEDQLLALGQELLTQGAQLAVVGYRRSASARLRDVWPVGPVLPGLIAIRADRFPTLPDEELRAVSPSGTLKVSAPQGWLMPFPAPADLSQDQSSDLLESWEGVLDLLSRHDTLALAQAAQTS